MSVIDSSGECLGVGVFGNPPRVWQGTGRGVITRCATEGAENACSMIYGALCRATKALGYREAWTYTLPEEPGTSLRAAGFMDMGLTAGGEWDCPSRPRKAAVRSEPKRRWLRRLAADAPPRPPLSLSLERLRAEVQADRAIRAFQVRLQVRA